MLPPIPSAVLPLLLQFSSAFSDPTALRFLVLMGAAILTTGRRTVSNLLRTVPAIVRGHPSSYHRVFSRRIWSLWPLAKALARFIVRVYFPEGPIPLAVDDTVDEHRGKKVYGKACHRDAVRSTHSFTAYRWGHKWVVLSILVKFRFARRPWALPVLVALYRSKEWNREHDRRHKTPAQLARQMLCVLMRWFPERKFVLCGDGGYSTHDLAYVAGRRPNRAAVVGRFYPDANLYEPPPTVLGRQQGRPRKKGNKLPSPQEVVARSRRTRLHVSWYGGGMRDVAVVTGTGYWYKSGVGLVEVRWVFVRDLSGTHRDEYFFSTDVRMTARQIIETFTGRWSLEVTFEEMRAYLGLESTRGRSENTVLRMVPCLFGLYSVVALIYASLPARERSSGRVNWVGKRETTYSDAITAVRRHLWVGWIFERGGHAAAFSKIPRSLRVLLLRALAPAA